MKYLSVLALLCASCGVNVNGKVDTSGTQTVKIDLESLISFFKLECEAVNNTQESVDTCVSRFTQDLADYVSKKN